MLSMTHAYLERERSVVWYFSLDTEVIYQFILDGTLMRQLSPDEFHNYLDETVHWLHGLTPLRTLPALLAEYYWSKIEEKLLEAGEPSLSELLAAEKAVRRREVQ